MVETSGSDQTSSHLTKDHATLPIFRYGKVVGCVRPRRMKFYVRASARPHKVYLTMPRPDMKSTLSTIFFGVFLYVIKVVTIPVELANADARLSIEL